MNVIAENQPSTQNFEKTLKKTKIWHHARRVKLI